jgi:hypothetical protein
MDRTARYTLAYLKILSWINRAPDASHYIGYITFNGKDTYVERTLTFDEALDLNNREFLVYGTCRFKRNPGEKSKEFLTEKELIDRARKIFHKEIKTKGAVALVKGERIVIEAMPVICVHRSSYNSIMRKANKLYKQIETLYDVDQTEQDIDYKKIDALEEQWWELIKELSK